MFRQNPDGSVISVLSHLNNVKQNLYNNHFFLHSGTLRGQVNISNGGCKFMCGWLSWQLLLTCVWNQLGNLWVREGCEMLLQLPLCNLGYLRRQQNRRDRNNTEVLIQTSANKCEQNYWIINERRLNPPTPSHLYMFNFHSLLFF